MKRGDIERRVKRWDWEGGLIYICGEHGGSEKGSEENGDEKKGRKMGERKGG